jgi:hypothetical protein
MFSRPLRCALRRPVLSLSLAFAASACGGSGPDRTASNPPSDAAADSPGVSSVDQPADSVIPGDTSTRAPAPTGPDRWTAGIVEKIQATPGAVVVLDARVAQNEGFDRLVVEFDGDEIPSYHVEYVDRPIRQCGSGEEVAVAGDGWLSVRVHPANAHNEQGQPTITERSTTPDLPIVRQMTIICDFEAQVEWVLGVRSPNPYRVMELADPARLVIDIRHE